MLGRSSPGETRNDRVRRGARWILRSWGTRPAGPSTTASTRPSTGAARCARRFLTSGPSSSASWPSARSSSSYLPARTYLALFFHPSEHEIIYHGSYAKLDGLSASEAYVSALNISFDVRGGLLAPHGNDSSESK